MEKHKYTEEELEFLRQNVEGTTLQEQTDLFNARFGTNLSKDKIKSIKALKKIKPKTPPPPPNYHRIQKGQSVCQKHLVGHERFKASFSGDIYEIKVAEPNVWRPKHHVLYEQYHNVKLPDNAKVIFVDGNRTNFDKDNLRLV
ncbi:MAG: HNH endonuclease [Lachnospiraceae bacterium]|nr:HNH endonuclease [Lachnospiraceae bacterium]